MKKVLQKQRSALKFLASARPSHPSEPAPKKSLLTTNESDNLFTTLEEDFNNILKMLNSENVTTLDKKLQKLWSLILTLRKNEVMLRDFYDRKDASKPSPLKPSRTLPSLKKHGSERMDSKVEIDGDDIDQMTTETKPESSFAVSESEITATKEMFEREKQHLFKEIISLKEKLSKSGENIHELNKKIVDSEERVKELKNDLESRTAEALKEMKIRQSLENRVKELQKQIEVKEKEAENLEFQYQNAREQVKLLESTVNEQKLTNELLSQNNSHLSQKILKLQTEYNSQTTMLEDLIQNCSLLTSQSKIYEENASKLLSDLNKLTKSKEMLQKRIQTLETHKKDLQNDKEKFIVSIGTLEKELENWRKTCDNEKRNVEDLKREKELIFKNFQRINATNDEQSRILKIEVRMKSQLETEVNQLNREISKLNDTVTDMDKERDRLKIKNSEFQNKIDELKEKLDEKESELLETKKQLNEITVSYKHQSGLLENIRNDKNMYAHGLTQTKEQVTELKQSIKVLKAQIEEEKDTVNVKENELLKEKSVLQKLEQDKEKLYGEIAYYKDTIKINNETINELQDTEKNLRSIIQKMNSELDKKDKQIQQIISEHKLAATQLLQKNEEIAQLNTKIKLWETTMEKQEYECKLHLEEIDNLTSEIRHLKTDKAALNRNLSTVVNLRSEVFALERELTKQKVKCRALEEELQNPLNIHRWRKLEGTDPNAYELVTKIQLLQKRVLTKSELAAEKEQQLKELETLYKNLKNITAKVSPAEITNKMYFLRKESEDKSRKIKNLIVQMSMYESHSIECKMELERKNKELEDMKKDYFKQKQKLYKLKNKLSKTSSQSSNENVKVTTLGGGFSAECAPLPIIKINDQ